MRRLGHYAQMLQSHVTAYFYLVLPEMLFGIDAPPEQRNVLGLIEADPELVKRVVMLRKWGQEMLVAVFGKRMHGISSVPGGVNNSLTAADVDRFLRGADGLPSVDRVIEDAQLGLELFYDFHEKHRVGGRQIRVCARAQHVSRRRRWQRGLLRRQAEDRRRRQERRPGVRLPRLPRPLLGGCRKVELYEVSVPHRTRLGRRLSAGRPARPDERHPYPVYPARCSKRWRSSTRIPAAARTI